MFTKAWVKLTDDRYLALSDVSAVRLNGVEILFRGSDGWECIWLNDSGDMPDHPLLYLSECDRSRIARLVVAAFMQWSACQDAACWEPMHVFDVTGTAKSIYAEKFETEKAKR